MSQRDTTAVPQGPLLGAIQIVEKIIKPLLQDDCFEPFHKYVSATLRTLNEGSLSTIREVEAEIIRRSCVSSFH